MQKRLFIYIIIGFILLCTGCNKTDLTPAFIYITVEDVNNCVDVSTFNSDHDLNYDAEQLSALQQHNFSHVNVYVDNKNLGCWMLPCKIPVLGVHDGDSSIVTLLPCFRRTGMSATIQGYPFFNVLRKKAMLRKGETYHVSENPPVYQYSNIAHFPFFETFANSSSFTATDTANSPHTFYPTIVDGRSAGEIVLHGDEHFDVISSDIPVPVYNQYIFIEVTCKIEGDMNIGLKLGTGQYPNTVHPIGGVYATNGEWKTLYFDISDIVYEYHYTGGAASIINIVLEGIGDAQTAQTHYCIDNIKVIYERSA